MKTIKHGTEGRLDSAASVTDSYYDQLAEIGIEVKE